MLSKQGMADRDSDDLDYLRKAIGDLLDRYNIRVLAADDWRKMRGCDYAEAGMVQTLAQGIDDEKLKRFLCDEFHPHHLANGGQEDRSAASDSNDFYRMPEQWAKFIFHPDVLPKLESLRYDWRTDFDQPVQYPGRWRPSGRCDPEYRRCPRPESIYRALDLLHKSQTE